jgi:Mlc titration factor MtfA (ptsG expression regulator)
LAPWILAGLALFALATLFGPHAWQQLRRARLRRQPFPAAWREILRRRMPFFATLPADLQQRLRKHVQVLVAEKPFIGCAGLVVTEEMRVLVAAQAALLLLSRPAGDFPNLREVLLYPGAFVVQRDEHDGAGLVHQGRRALAGESWQRGQVILSWDDVLAGAATPDDGRNVVIHEFAHQLDQQSGHANGAPFLGRRDRYAAWSATLGTAFAQLRLQIERGEPPWVDPYGATDPAEFFAVVSEQFFERPFALAGAQPALYRAFADYYGVDPLSW